MLLRATTIDELAREEARLVESAQSRYGVLGSTALDALGLLSSCLKSVSEHSFLFAAALASINKSMVLAYFSTVRRHDVQAHANMRQALEFASLACFYCANRHKDYHEPDEDGVVRDFDKIKNASQEWMAKNFPQNSEELKYLKGEINKTSSHANMMNASRNIDFSMPEDGFYNTSYFDREDIFYTEIRLWEICRASFVILKALQETIQNFGGAVLSDNFQLHHSLLAARCVTTLESLTQSDRYQAFRELKERRSHPSSSEA